MNKQKRLKFSTGNGFQSISTNEREECIILFLARAVYKTEFEYGSKVRASTNAKRLWKAMSAIDGIKAIDFGYGQLEHIEL